VDRRDYRRGNKSGGASSREKVHSELMVGFQELMRRWKRRVADQSDSYDSWTFQVKEIKDGLAVSNQLDQATNVVVRPI
jgi:hypothetical protein